MNSYENRRMSTSLSYSCVPLANVGIRFFYVYMHFYYSSFYKIFICANSYSLHMTLEFCTSSSTGKTTLLLENFIQEGSLNFFSSFFHTVLYPDSNPPLVVVMVGLPARGKTYMSRRLTRYLNWIGIYARGFQPSFFFNMFMYQNSGILSQYSTYQYSDMKSSSF